MTERIPNPAVAELTVNGQLVYYLEQRQEGDLSDIETAAMVVSLRSLADSLESTNLEKPASDILEETDHSFALDDLDDPDNVD